LPFKVGCYGAWNHKSKIETISGYANTVQPHQKFIQWVSFDSMILVESHLQAIASFVHAIQDE
jgi:hypothetical protein